MQVGVAKYVNSVSKAGMTIGATTGRHTDRHVWTPFKSTACQYTASPLQDRLRTLCQRKNKRAGEITMPEFLRAVAHTIRLDK